VAFPLLNTKTTAPITPPRAPSPNSFFNSFNIFEIQPYKKSGSGFGRLQVLAVAVVILVVS
jgi:hypothetical protein